jgi:hypothetical protein
LDSSATASSYPAEQQDKEAQALTQGICSHGYDDWTECAGCTWMADHWDDEDIKRTGALW